MSTYEAIMTIYTVAKLLVKVIEIHKENKKSTSALVK